ncbi:MAG: hypothetical protein IC227_00635 [Enterococcus lacertideformus]|uniref:Uncharacterized protein n=1 Tax=Enterococcus lacertideformus TaxID=2771493 RepID=A0A931FBU6_9ENTE|nr:hypothetical protein [Enterococcus lacertideformus]
MLSVSNAITYSELFDFSNSKKFLLLTDFISEVYPNDDDNRKEIMSEVQNRPHGAMAKLFNSDKKLYKQFLRIELAEDFDRAQSVIGDIKICRLKKQEKDELIADVNRRLAKFKPREIVLARSMKKLEAGDKSLSQKFRAISEDSLEWKKEIEKVRNLIIENQFNQTIKEKIQNDPVLTEELRNILLKNIEVSNISPSSKESMNREKSKGEEKIVACFLYSHYTDLENQKKIVLTKVQPFKDSLQTINSKFLDILKKNRKRSANSFRKVPETA